MGIQVSHAGPKFKAELAAAVNLQTQSCCLFKHVTCQTSPLDGVKQLNGALLTCGLDRRALQN
jgi:hypothetical protein